MLLIAGLVGIFLIVKGLIVAFEAYDKGISFSESLSNTMSTAADVFGWLGGGLGSFFGNVALKMVGVTIATVFAVVVFHHFFGPQDPKK